MCVYVCIYINAKTLQLYIINKINNNKNKLNKLIKLINFISRKQIYFWQ